MAHPVPGLVVVAGGKYTTYRVMAKDAVDAAVHGLDAKVAGVGHRERAAARRRGLPARCGTRRTCWPVATACTWRAIEHLLDRYGSLIDEVLDLVVDRPDAGRAAARGAGLPARRDRLRGLARGRPAPRRRADPADPDLDRDVRPGHRLGGGGGPADGAGARLERRAGAARGRALPQAGRGRAGEPAACPTTRPPTRPGWAPRRSSRSPEAVPTPGRAEPGWNTAQHFRLASCTGSSCDKSGDPGGAWQGAARSSYRVYPPGRQRRQASAGRRNCCANFRCRTLACGR